jgi:hypothetical protein
MIIHLPGCILEKKTFILLLKQLRGSSNISSLHFHKKKLNLLHEIAAEEARVHSFIDMVQSSESGTG